MEFSAVRGDEGTGEIAVSGFLASRAATARATSPVVFFTPADFSDEPAAGGGGGGKDSSSSGGGGKNCSCGGGGKGATREDTATGVERGGSADGGEWEVVQLRRLFTSENSGGGESAVDTSVLALVTLNAFVVRVDEMPLTISDDEITAVPFVLETEGTGGCPAGIADCPAAWFVRSSCKV